MLLNRQFSICNTMDKQQLRKYYRNIRKSISDDIKSEYDNLILNNILSLDEYKNSDTIFTYVSFDNETDTKKLISKAIYDNKRIAVPYCVPNTFIIDFYFINSINELTSGSFGILEPNIISAEKVIDYTKGICIIPGLSFTYNGDRLGYGRGYYDRFLENFSGIKIGICYECQITNELPKDKYDKSMNIIVSERHIRRIY